MTHTTVCIISDCRKKAVSHCGHVKSKEGDVLAGWCKKHSRRFNTEPKADSKGCYGKWEKWMGQEVDDF